MQGGGLVAGAARGAGGEVYQAEQLAGAPEFDQGHLLGCAGLETEGGAGGGMMVSRSISVGVSSMGALSIEIDHR